MGDFLGNTVGGLFGFNQGMAEGMGALANYNAAPAPISQMDFISAIQAQQAKQAQLASMLEQQAQGGGPNPAMAQLNMTRNQNIAQNQGMISSQKGINPALAQRMGAQNAAMMNQQAAGQGALMRANQQIAAQGMLGQQNLGMMSILNAGQASQNDAINSAYGHSQALNQATELQNARQRGLISGSILNSVGGGMGAMFAGGGQVPHSGLNIQTLPMQDAAGGDPGGPMGGTNPFHEFMRSIGQDGGMTPAVGNTGAGGGPGLGGADMMSSLGAMAGPGAVGMAQGGGVAGPQSYHGQYLTQNMVGGGAVRGRAMVKGDSYQNDVVDAKLSPDEIVIPRSIATGSNAPDRAKAFVEAVLAQKRGMA